MGLAIALARRRREQRWEEPPTPSAFSVEWDLRKRTLDLLAVHLMSLAARPAAWHAGGGAHRCSAPSREGCGRPARPRERRPQPQAHVRHGLGTADRGGDHRVLPRLQLVVARVDRRHRGRAVRRGLRREHPASSWRPSSRTRPPARPAPRGRDRYQDSRRTPAQIADSNTFAPGVDPVPRLRALRPRTDPGSGGRPRRTGHHRRLREPGRGQGLVGGRGPGHLPPARRSGAAPCGHDLSNKRSPATTPSASRRSTSTSPTLRTLSCAHGWPTASTPTRHGLRSRPSPTTTRPVSCWTSRSTRPHRRAVHADPRPRHRADVAHDHHRSARG